MPTPRLTVTTDVGTFSRQTARPYTHVVVVRGKRLEWLEAHRLRELASMRREADAYTRGVDCHGTPLQPRWFEEGKVAEWIESLTKAADALDAKGPFTSDLDAETWVAASWSSRADLASKAAVAEELDSYREVRVYEIATGTRVSMHTRQVVAPRVVAESWARRNSVRRRRAGRRFAGHR